MIIVRITGGLGNQMFQYAAARRLAHVHRSELKIDKSIYDTYTLHQYSLPVFNIIENYASKQEIENLAGRLGIFRNFRSSFGPLAIIESHFHFDKNIADLPDNVYLVGYWQSNKYFQDMQNIIRKEFTFVTSPNKRNANLISAIRHINSVSLHVRRGNYVSNPATNKHHGTCSLQFYRKAIAIIAQRVKKPGFVIFSDDPDWCKANLRLRYPTVYVSHNLGKKDYEDMRLMSECEHNIIANSTFSWWGAWLNSNPDKIVIAPKNWFNDKSINTKDLIPQSWIKI